MTVQAAASALGAAGDFAAAFVLAAVLRRFK